jgi:hypothetical protein
VIAAEVVVQRVERHEHVGGRPHRPESVVLVDLRNAEDLHDGIADELLDGSAVTLDRGAHRVEEALHHSSQRFRSSPAPIAVEPTTSQKTIVTVLRASDGASARTRATAHSPQNLLVSGLAWPHAGM